MTSATTRRTSPRLCLAGGLVILIAAVACACTVPAAGPRPPTTVKSSAPSSPTPSFSASAAGEPSPTEPIPTPVLTPGIQACQVIGASLDAVYPGRYTTFGLDNNEWEPGANACWVLAEDADDNSGASLRILPADRFEAKPPGKGFRKRTIHGVGDQAVLFTADGIRDHLYVRTGERFFILAFDQGLKAELKIAREIISRLG